MKSSKTKRTLNKVIKDLNKASRTHARQARTLKKVVSSKRKKKR